MWLVLAIVLVALGPLGAVACSAPTGSPPAKTSAAPPAAGSGASAAAPAATTAAPAAARSEPLRSTSRETWEGFAPSASRTPNSRPRCVTP